MEKDKNYELGNGFMINVKQYISSVDYKVKYHINIIDKESEYNKEYVQTGIFPFWETLEEFTFDNPKEANNQFLISYDYYKNYER